MDDAALAVLEQALGQTVPHGDALFLNAQPQAFLKSSAFSALTVQSFFKPDHDRLTAAGFAPVTAPDPDRAWDSVLALAPKNIQETMDILQRASRLLKPGGRMIIAAANNAGGRRLEDLLEGAGFSDRGSISKSRARATWGTRPVSVPATTPLLRAVENADFVSAPGLFAWDRIDEGSALLARHLPQNLEGRGADFGCGWGYLSRHVLRHNPGIENLICADADWRAVQACAQNLGKDPRARLMWEDLQQPLKTVRDRDWIVMNPPFHEGKSRDSGIGRDFIRSARTALRSGGTLWMVANTHLPYERTLAAAFSRHDILARENGFKILRAIA